MKKQIDYVVYYPMRWNGKIHWSIEFLPYVKINSLKDYPQNFISFECGWMFWTFEIIWCHISKSWKSKEEIGG